MVEGEKIYDLLVIGGGINGVGIARDAAGRGLSVILCEKDDLASHTSSWSTKLIHGGLRYLEQYEFRLVREALREREVLLEAAPHLVAPLRFVLPYQNGLRPQWMLRLGLFLYDNLGGRGALQSSSSVDLTVDPAGDPLSAEFTSGFEYTDCSVDDSRLVVANAVDAHQRGAAIKTRTEFVAAHRSSNHWIATLRGPDGKEYSVQCRALVNAAGPWVTSALERVSGATVNKKLRLVKGSHLIMRSLFQHDKAYIFQNKDGRIIFAIPYLDGTTLIGTTDIAFDGDPAAARVSEYEKEYLLGALNEYFHQSIKPTDILGSFSGVRPLYDEIGETEASAVTRDYAFDIDADDGAPLLSVFGGKLTTYRKLAEHALEKLMPLLELEESAWTRSAALPGGDSGYGDWEELSTSLDQMFSFLPEAHRARLISAHGSALPSVLQHASCLEDLGREFAPGLFQVEVDHMIKNEFVTTAEDILFRRTKIGRNATSREREDLAAYLHQCGLKSVAFPDLELDPLAQDRELSAL